ncbi:MAG: transcription termination/antitermination protein NusA [Oscillospiraceae bacterium]|nr:transcription termination/antitermination protein NusA [Oscillospiraceae bacterium]
MDNNFFEALADLGTENSVDADVVIEKVKSAMQKAAQRMYPDCKECIRVDIDPAKKIFDVVLLQEVVDEEPYNDTQVYIDEARAIDPHAYVGGILERKLDIAKFGRASAQSAKQSIKGDLRDINRDRILEKFECKVKDIITATVTQVEPGRGSATLMYDKTELYLLRQEQIPGEVLREGMSIKVYVTDIANRSKKPIIKLSRVHRDLVKRLFELEVPEIYDGTVVVKAISREAGSRSKIAVQSLDPNVDAIGACIGPKRSRISAIVKELNGEKIDIIPYSEDPAEFISRALAPAKVLAVHIIDNGEETFSEQENDPRQPKLSAIAVVPHDQLSLAIGNKGQNAKLAAKLTGCKIDIKSDQEEFEIPAPKPKMEEELFSDTVNEDEELFAEEETAEAAPETAETTEEAASEETAE